jgi:hypothetical protein
MRVGERDRESKKGLYVQCKCVCVYMFAGVKDGCVNCVGRGVWCECHMQNIERSVPHIYAANIQCQGNAI